MVDKTQQAYSVEQAATLLAVTPDAIRKRIKRGTLHGVKDAGGAWQVLLDGEQSAPDKTQDGTRRKTGQDPPPDTRHQQDGMAARVAALEAENTLQRELIEQARQEATRWQQQADNLTLLLSQQQQLALADKTKHPTTEIDGDQVQPGTKKRRRFLWW